MQDNRKTTVSIITQKDELAKELEAHKRLLKSCTGNVETMKMVYANSEWWQLLTETDPALDAKVKKAQSQWEVKYVVCESVCRAVESALGDSILLSKIAANLKRGVASEISLLECFTQIIAAISSQYKSEIRSCERLLEGQP